ncbi:MAG: sensor histidine kinase [Candidatus Bipolaricaulia bacterium]
MIYIGGPWLATWGVAVGSLSGEILARKSKTHKLRAIKIAFNAFQFSFAAFIGGIFFIATGGVAGEISLPNILSAVAAGVIYFVVNIFLLSMIFSLTTEKSFFTVWKLNLRNLTANYLALTPLGILLGIIYLQIGVIGIILVAGPLLLARYGFKFSAELQRKYEELEQAHGELKRAQRQLRYFLDKLITAQEEERRLVAYDIHDGLTQMIISAGMHLNTYISLRSRDPTYAKQELEKGMTRLNKAIAEARRVVSELRPSTLDDLGLIPTLRQYLEDLQEELGWQVDFHENLGDTRLDPTLEVAVFRIVQEALTNIRKHAETKQVRVAIEQQNGSLQLEIQDWGVGFVPRAIEVTEASRKQLGIVGIKERASLLGGNCTTDSRPGRGTTVRVQVPLNLSNSTVAEDVMKEDSEIDERATKDHRADRR